MHIGLNAHLLSNQPGYRSAGIHGYIQHLLLHMPRLAPDDWQFTVMVGGTNPAIFDGVTMRHAGFDTQSPFKRILWEQLIQPAQFSQFDLYHAMAFVAPMILSKPMVVTVYDLTFMRYPERLSTARRLYLRLFTGLTCQRAKRVLAISQSTGDDLHTLLGVPTEKIDVTPLGYDTEIYRPLPESEIADFRQRNGLPERFWLFIGTLEPRKNLPVLLEAYAKLPKSERLPLILAGGKGWGMTEIEATIAHLNLADEVSLPGFLPADEIALWYNAAEAFIYPSVFEGFGLPVLEAMACGTPVITSNVSSLPEVAGDSGLCIPPQDVDAWESALYQAYHDAVWRDSARERGLIAAQQFRWETTTQLTLESYGKAPSSD